MALGEHQKLTRVLPGRPFGNGSDGAYSSASIPTMTYRSCSGTSGTSTLTIASGAYSNGDILLIYQTRGSGVGQWEVNKITSGGGTTSLTLQKNLNYTYTDSGASQAQCVKILQYTNVTCSGTWTLSAWNGDTGGILAIAAKGTFTATSTVSASARGFRNGSGGSAPSGATRGEGYAQAGGVGGSTGDSGGESVSSAPGAGGGHGTAGTVNGFGGPETNGGKTSGNPDLTNITFGGGGAGGNGSGAGNGGDGGGNVFIFGSSIITSSGAIVSGGQNGTADPTGRGGGAGAGGSVLIVCGTATLGTNKITAPGATGGTGNGDASQQGGSGGVGRIAVHYSGSVTGTTNPTYTGTQDRTLREQGLALII